MALLSSKTLIKAHALFIFTLAVYLTKSPEVITDSDAIFMLGEVLKIDASPTFNRPQSPFAFCGVLLVVEAIVDLILATKLPRLNEILALNSRPPSDAGEPRIHPSLARLANLYHEIWTLVSASRFCLFFAVSFFIYQSKPDVWGDIYGETAGNMREWGAETGAVSGLDQLKNRVVFTYGFVEMMFWLWIFMALRDERREVVVEP